MADEVIKVTVIGEDKASNVFASLSNATTVLRGALDAGRAGFELLSKGIGFSIQQASEAELAQATLAETVESTGMAAGLTVDELNAMASSLQDVTTFGDETINRGQQLLLTFTAIGGEIFPRATEATLDMASVFGSVDAAAVQLGKALNDPINGVSALQRVGVSFTESQKEQIRVLQESGDMMGAQTVILDELARQFGGQARAAAETFTGQMMQVENQVGEAAEMVGTAMIPALETLADETMPSVISAIESLTPVVKDVATGVVDQVTLMSSTAEWNALREQLIDSGATWGDINEVVDDGRAKLDLWRTAADMERDLDRNREGIDRMRIALEAVNAGLEVGTDEFFDYIRAQERNTEVAIAMTNAYRTEEDVIEDVTEETADLVEETENYIFAQLDAEDALAAFQETIDERTLERLTAIFGDETLALDYLRQAMNDAGQASDDYELSADQLGATISDTTIPALGDYYTETDRARGITRDARDEIDQLKADMLGIAGPAQEGASAFGRAAFEIWQDAQEAAGQVSDLNDELDDLTGFYEAEITTPGAQDAIDIIAILKGKAEETAGTYEIIYNVTVTGDEPPEGGGATGGGTGNLPAPEEPAFLHGGYTGATGGIVDPHEFVFSSPAVQAIGLENLEAMHRLAKTGQSAGSTINHFNMTVHTSASTSTVTQDFHLMQSLAGNH